MKLFRFINFYIKLTKRKKFKEKGGGWKNKNDLCSLESLLQLFFKTNLENKFRQI